MSKKNTSFCPYCNKEVEYNIKQDIVKEYKGFEVNTIENIGVCNKCGRELLVTELEIDNLTRLYNTYERLKLNGRDC